MADNMRMEENGCWRLRLEQPRRERHCNTGRLTETQPWMCTMNESLSQDRRDRCSGCCLAQCIGPVDRQQQHQHHRYHQPAETLSVTDYWASCQHQKRPKTLVSYQFIWRLERLLWLSKPLHLDGWLEKLTKRLNHFQHLIMISLTDLQSRF